MSWHELSLGLGSTDGGERVWQLLWAASVAGEQAVEGSAVFLRKGEQGRRRLYFPPCASLLATSVGARPCAKPGARGLAVLAGQPGAWQVHFGAARVIATAMGAPATAA